MTHPVHHSSRRRRPLAATALASCLLAAASASFAADMPAGKAADDKLGPARAHIAQQRWPAAIDELKRLNDTGSADWHNLMGYSLRKASPPDYAGAERHYTEALRLNPQHRGALEYSGELFLLIGDLPRAEQQLARLDKACLLPCEEYTDLKRAVAHYKAGK
jgi:Flp pilus assembly protein TadD